MTEVGIGNRKDIRDGVESALKAASWSATTSHNRSQVMYYLAENFSKRKDEFTTYLENLLSDNDTDTQVENSIRNLFYYAAWSDKLDGIVHQAPIRANTLAINEPIGVIAILCQIYVFSLFCYHIRFGNISRKSSGNYSCGKKLSYLLGFFSGNRNI